MTHTRANLQGTDTGRVLEAHERAGASAAGVAQDYMTAIFLAEMAEVLSIQQQRIEELQQALVQRRDKTEKLEKAQPKPAETKPKTTRKRSQ